jgi:hypothetical protein
MKLRLLGFSVALFAHATPALTAGILDNRFFSCSVANEAGVANVPTARFYVPAGWKHTSDRDGDGISCEPKRSR